MNGGVDESALRQSFSKIREDIAILSQEIVDLKKEYKSVLQENIELKKQLSSKDKLDPLMIKQIVEAAIGSAKQKPDRLTRKLNRNRKLIIKNRILELANEKKMTLPAIKDIIVDDEELCSKATFYRYIEKLKKQHKIDEVGIDEEIIISTV